MEVCRVGCLSFRWGEQPWGFSIWILGALAFGESCIGGGGGVGGNFGVWDFRGTQVLGVVGCGAVFGLFVLGVVRDKVCLMGAGISLQHPKPYTVYPKPYTLNPKP